MDKRFYKISEVFLDKLEKNNQSDILRLQFLMYLYSCYQLLKDKEDYDVNFYELDYYPFSITLEALYKFKPSIDITLDEETINDINGIYNNFGKLSNASIYALVLDNHYSNHFKIYNEKNNKPIRKDYMKKWFYESFITDDMIDKNKINDKASLTLEFFKYTPNEVTYKTMYTNPDYDSVINYSKEIISLFKKDNIKLNQAKLGYILYLSECYYMAYENKEEMFKQDFLVNEYAPIIPAINSLYPYLLETAEESEESSYIHKSDLTIDYEAHSPNAYIKKVYALYKDKTATELENILYQTESPYTILKKYGKDKNYTIPKKMSKDWLKKKLPIIERVQTKKEKEQNNIIKGISKLFGTKQPVIKSTYNFYEYSYQRYCKKEMAKKILDSNDVMLNTTKKIISKFSNDNKHISLEHLNMLMYLIDGFYEKELFPYSFKVESSIPSNEVLTYFASDYMPLNGHIIKPNKDINYTLDSHINEYIDYMYNVFNDISSDKLKRLCMMENSPAYIAKNYTKDKIVSKDMTKGWLRKEFSYEFKLEYDINKIKTKINNITKKN